MKKYLTEFIGTFFLVLVVAMTGNPIAIGAVLVALVYMGGYISGAHYNPAVTLGMLVAKKIELKEAGFYMLTQVLAATVAAIVYFGIKGETFAPHPTGDFFISTLVEILFTFILVSVIMHTAASEKTEGNHYYGLAIGLTLMAAAFTGGAISGGVYNPAIMIGPMLIDFSHFVSNLPNLLIYLIGPFTGGALAAVVFNYLTSEDDVSSDFPMTPEEYPDETLAPIQE